MSGGQDIYTTQRLSHEAIVRAKDAEIERLTADLSEHNQYANELSLDLMSARAKVDALNEDCTALMRIAAEAYDCDDLGMTFNDWLDMNGYRFDNEAALKGAKK